MTHDPNLSVIQNFPDDFVWGAATSSYQIEGSSFGGCGQSHWDSFSREPGRTKNGENGSIACDHYHRWPDDLDLVRDGGFNAYRFSLSWARLLPHGHDSVNPDAIRFYNALIDGMWERGLKPFATLYHWDLPQWVANAGGWQTRSTCEAFARYTDLVMRHFGDRLHAVAPINEPWCVSWLSHYDGHHAPGLRSLKTAAQAMHWVNVAHGMSVRVLRDHGHQNIGSVLNKEANGPVDDSDAAHRATRLFDGIFNRWFEDALFRGAYPDDVLSLLGAFMPQGFERDLPLISQPMDWAGLNYYTRTIIQPDHTEPHLGFRAVRGDLPQTTMGWEIFPEGLSGFLCRMAHDIAPGLSLYITENGMADHDPLVDGQVDDSLRIDYFDRHLRTALEVLNNHNVPLKGYFAWSLLDNYEWAYGYDKRFGLVHVDYSTLRRTPKRSWQAFQKALQE